MNTETDKTYRCPFCLHEFTKEKAEELKKRENLNYYKCPSTEKDLTGRLCNKRLPEGFFDSEHKVICLIGGPGTGKTYFLIALINILQKQALFEFGFSATMYYPDNSAKVFYDKLLNQHESKQHIEATQLDAGAEKHAFCLQVNNNRIKNKPRTIFLSIFDNPGEGFKLNEGFMLDNTKLLSADAVICLISPEQIESFGDEIKRMPTEDPKGRKLAGVSNEPEMFSDILENVRRAMSRKNVNTLKSKISTPFAFCLSKYDLVESKMDLRTFIPRDDWRSDIIKFYEYNVHKPLLQRLLQKEICFDKIDNLSDDISYFFKGYSTGSKEAPVPFFEISKRIPEYFSNYKLFVVRSITQNWELQPKGISLPLIWILNELKLY